MVAEHDLGLPFRDAGAYRGRMEDAARSCVLCNNPIETGQAWLRNDGGEAAHSACVYRDERPEARERWMPPEFW